MNDMRSIYLIVCVLGISIGQTGHAETCEYFKLDARGEYVFGFPAKIADLKMLDQGVSDNSGIGFFTNYGADGVFLHVNVYNGGDSDIPDGIESGRILSQYEDVKSRLDQMKAYGRQYELRHDGISSFGSSAMPVLEAQYDLNDGRSNRVSHIFLAAKHGDFVEAKLTYPASKQEQSSDLLEHIKTALGTVFCDPQPHSIAKDGKLPDGDLMVRTIEPVGVKILAPQNWLYDVKSGEPGISMRGTQRASYNLSSGVILKYPASPPIVEQGDPKPVYVFYPDEGEPVSTRPESNVILIVSELGRARAEYIPMMHDALLRAMKQQFGQKGKCMSAELDIEYLSASLCVIRDNKYLGMGNDMIYIVTNGKTGTLYHFSFSSPVDEWGHYFPIFASMVNSIEVDPKY